jgi:hypothetical protein
MQIIIRLYYIPLIYSIYFIKLWEIEWAKHGKKRSRYFLIKIVWSKSSLGYILNIRSFSIMVVQYPFTI